MSVILIDFFTGRWLSSCLDVGQTGSSNAMIAGKISQQLITCHFPRGGRGGCEKEMARIRIDWHAGSKIDSGVQRN